MKDKVIIKVYSNSLELVKYLINKGIDFIIIKEDKKCTNIKVFKDDLRHIKYFRYEILKEYSLFNIICFIKLKIYYIFLLCFAFLVFELLSNMVISVNINSSNLELVKDLNKTLDNYGIKRLTLKKSFDQINNIKNKVLEDYKERLEWIEIESVGMNYNIKLEERKKSILKSDNKVCDIVSTDDGMIVKIISSKGNVLVRDNQFVKEGDILISGHITLNDEEKQSVCASGEVYAEKWYSVSIDIPSTYVEKKYSGKVRNNLMFEFDNRDFKIFKSRLENFDEDKEEVISLFNKKIYLVKEVEYVLETKEYSEDALNKRIDEIVSEKLSLNLNAKERIIDKKVLKKEVNNSRIKIELFTRVEKMIGKQITY